jgi:hypothetical protein
VNPRIGSDLQYGRVVEEEQTAEVVKNHAGGTRMGIGVLISKEAPSAVPPGSNPVRGARPRNPGTNRGRGAARLWESDSSIGTMEGRSLDNPKRGNPALRPGRKDRNASDCWRQGQEGRASHYESHGERTGRRSSRTGSRRRGPRSRRAAVNGQGAATSTGVLPPAGGT